MIAAREGGTVRMIAAHYRQNRKAQSRVPGNRLPFPASKLQRTLLILGLSLLALLFISCAKNEQSPKAGPPEVNVVEVTEQDVPIYQEWVSQLNGPVNAEIMPKVQGYLLKQLYSNGYFVKKSQLLFEIDSRPFQAALDQAKADVAKAEANVARFETDLARDTPLAAQNAIPQKQVDSDRASLAAARAQLLAAKAAAENAALNLGWTKVYSPIDGIAGVSNSQIGDLVGTSTKMTTVSQVNPIWAYFNISESLFLSFAPQITGIITGKVSQAKLRAIPVSFIQANDVPYPQQGSVIYVNRQIGTQTGTIQLAAEFPNPQAVLRPGGFGRIRIKTGDKKNALLVPQAAVMEVQSQYQVIVLTADNKAMFRPVKAGDRIGTNWIITEGLKPGERVVVEGLQRVQTLAGQKPELAKEGIPVIPKPYVAEAGGSD